MPTIKMIECREAFVKRIKEENSYNPNTKMSLKQHWTGAEGGFQDFMVQRRWDEFKAGWVACTDSLFNSTI